MDIFQQLNSKFGFSITEVHLLPTALAQHSYRASLDETKHSDTEARLTNGFFQLPYLYQRLAKIVVALQKCAVLDSEVFLEPEFSLDGRPLFKHDSYVFHDDGEWTDFLEPLPADTSWKIPVLTA